MTRRDRLKRLALIARLKADRAAADLSRTRARCGGLRSQIVALDDARRAVLAEPALPADAARAQRYAAHLSDKRAALVAILAEAEQAREVALAQARIDEGRKIALDGLTDRANPRARC